jgi:hypothetical protein
LDVAVPEWFHMQEYNFNNNGIFKLEPGWHSSMPLEMMMKNYSSKE